MRVHHQDENQDTENIVVLLDGKLMALCYEADDEEGWCRAFDEDAYVQAIREYHQPHPKDRGDAPEFEDYLKKLHGKVEIVPKTPEHAELLYQMALRRAHRIRDAAHGSPELPPPWIPIRPPA